MDVIKLDSNQFVSSVQQILFNYLSEGREWVVQVVWRTCHMFFFFCFFLVQLQLVIGSMWSSYSRLTFLFYLYLTQRSNHTLYFKT